jgi:HAE1 family hydrophobic/amphiphilic exporter-1
VVSKSLERFFVWLNDRYDAGLTVALRHRFLTLMTFFGTVALTGYLFWVIPNGFFP